MLKHFEIECVNWTLINVLKLDICDKYSQISLE